MEADVERSPMSVGGDEVVIIVNVQTEKLESRMYVPRAHLKGDDDMFRYAFLFVLLVVFSVAGSSCATSGGNIDSQLTLEGSETRVYEVFGMDCPGCHGGLEDLVGNIPAIQQVKANWRTKQLVVTVRPGERLKDEDVYDAIQRANLTVGKRLE